MERSVYSARCFIENMKRTKMLRDVEFVVLEDWYDWCLKSANIETDLIGKNLIVQSQASLFYINHHFFLKSVYLRTSPEVVYQRMKARARKEENSVSLEYLKQIHDIHDEWLYHRNLFDIPAPVLVLNGNKSLDEMLVEFENCKNKIFGKRKEEKTEGKNVGDALSPVRPVAEIKTGVSD